MQSVRCTSSVRIKHSSVFLTVHLLLILCKVFKVSSRIVKHITIKATVCMSVHSQFVCSVCIRRNEVYFYKSKLEDGRVQMHVERLEDNPSEVIMSYQTISYHRVTEKRNLHRSFYSRREINQKGAGSGCYMLFCVSSLMYKVLTNYRD